MLGKRIFTTIIVSLLSLSGCAREGDHVALNLACNGCPTLFNVGFQELTFVDSARGRTLKTAIWYPTVNGPARSPDEFVGGGPNVSGGPYPVIMLSHGRGPLVYIREWVRHGFVVVAPDLQKSDFDPDYVAELQFARPLDIRYVLDQVLALNEDAASFLRGVIDPNSIGITGMSFGGHTTLMVAGATPNLDYLAEYCQANYDRWDICPLQDEIQALYPGQRIIDVSDPRMKAALPIVPDGYGWFRESGMAKIKIPIMLMGGEKDTTCPPDEQQRPMYRDIVSTKYLFIQDDADHLSYLDGCAYDIDTLSTCSALHAQSIPATTAFWMLYLKSDPVCGDPLRTCVPFLPGVEFASAVADGGAG